MHTDESTSASPPTNLDRFLTAQESIFDQALAELRRGRKESHWMWFVFPQIAGLGSSPTARAFAIRDRAEARAYLAHPILGSRIHECCQALLGIEGRSANEILGFPDDLKLLSSMTLFSLVSKPPSVFDSVIQRYYSGEPDQRTLALLQASDRK